MTLRRIVLATGNPHKVAELRAILTVAASAVRVLGLNGLQGPADRWSEPVEHGATFAENARIKALEYARQTGELCLADDSGLEIEALGGRPGVISSHYATDGLETGISRTQRDAANNARVLCELDGVAPERRGARFVCCMCVAQPPEAGRPAKVLFESRGTFEGRIGVPPRVPSGADGFGYDPLFLVAPAYERTAAELPSGEKNRLSHRAAAAAGVAAWLRDHGRGSLDTERGAR